MNKTSFWRKAYMGGILVFMYLPIAIVILYSFNAGRLSSVWEGFSLRWYGQLLQNRSLLEALQNSLILAFITSVASGVIGTLGAVGIQKSRLFGKRLAEHASMLPIMIPEIILGVVFLAFFSLIGLPRGLTTLIIAHTSFGIPYVYLLVKARLSGMDKSLEEAARDLGAGEARAFWDVTLPLIAPALASGMLLAFAMSLDDVIISLFVAGVDFNTLPMKIYTQMRTAVTPEINALGTLMFLFTLLLALFSAWLSQRGRRHS